MWRKFDRSKDSVKLLESICKDSGSENVKKESAYIRTAVFNTKDNPEKLWCEILGDYAFYLCYRNKNFIRNIFTVVRGNRQKQGIGTKLVRRLFKRMANESVYTLKLRTSMDNSALGFWEKQGAKIIDVNKNDYEMVIDIRNRE